LFGGIEQSLSCAVLLSPSMKEPSSFVLHPLRLLAMQHTRTTLTAIVRASSRAHALSPRTSAIAALHTTRIVSAEEKRGFLSRLNPFAKQTTPSPKEQPSTQNAKTAAELNVEIAEEEAPIPRCVSLESLTAFAWKKLSREVAQKR
jgi:hypothetical protein